MKIYFKDKTELVQYVTELLDRLEKGSVSTMTIIPGQFADFSASIAIGTLSADTEKTKDLNSFSQRMNTLHKNTQGG